jgi:hypothetical protein
VTESEWLVCDEPDLMLEALQGKVGREQLLEFVRACWGRITPYLPPWPHGYTVVDQFAEVVAGQSDHDAVTYASEAALKAAGWAPDLREEQRHQAELLRQIVGNPFRPSGPQPAPSRPGPPHTGRGRSPR